MHREVPESISVYLVTASHCCTSRLNKIMFLLSHVQFDRQLVTVFTEYCIEL